MNYELQKPHLFTPSFMNPSVRFRLDTIMDYKDTPFSNKITDEPSYFDNFSECIYSLYLNEMRVRWAMRQLANLFILRQIDKKTKPEIDLITMQPVAVPIHIYDIPTRRKYSFEARELSRLIRTNLLHQRTSFPEPLQPKNTYTNRLFSYQQLVSIYYQLEKSGHMTWPLALYREYDFRIERFKSIAYRPLTIHSIKEEIDDLGSEESTEAQINFLETIAFTANFPLSTRKRETFEAALQVIPNHPIMASFRSLTFMSLEAAVIGKNIDTFLAFSATRLLEKWDIIRNHPLVKRRLRELEEEEEELNEIADMIHSDY
jgi:hypothetical protein